MSASEPRDPKERLLRVLRKHPVDRPPVICAGGSMTAAVLEAIGEDASLPAAHSSPVLMANLCADPASNWLRELGRAALYNH